jgi:hypothetical protein
MITASALLVLAVVAAWFAIFVCGHMWSLRSGANNAQWLVRSYAVSLAATLITVAAVSLWRDQPTSLSLMIATLTSACLFVLYVPAIYTILTSLSVATLVLLLRNGGQISQTSLYDRFATRSIIDQRLSVLVGSGYLVEDGKGFSLSRKGRVVARAFAFVKRVWGLGPGG